MKIVIGLVGEKGGGKETCATVLKECLLPYTKVSSIRSSDLLSETLSLWNLPSTRENLQKMAIVMDGGYGKGTLTKAVRARIEQDPAGVVIFDGVRWFTDSQMIRSFPNHFLIYVTATLELRYERTRRRKSKVGEGNATLKQFIKEESVATELEIPSIGETADIKLVNDGSLEELRSKIINFCSKKIDIIIKKSREI